MNYAFWERPDWSGGNLRDGGQPFWMLEPLPALTPDAPVFQLGQWINLAQSGQQAAYAAQKNAALTFYQQRLSNLQNVYGNGQPDCLANFTASRTPPA